MTFEDICNRLKELGGEQVEENVLESVDGADLAELRSMDFEKTACFALALDRSYLELRAVAYTACRTVIVFAYDDGGEGDFLLFGVPYLDFKFEQTVRSAILKNMR